MDEMGKRNNVITFRCSDLVFAQLYAIALQREWSLGHVVRHLVEQGLETLCPIEEVQQDV